MNYSYTNIRISDEAIGIQKMPHFSPLRDPGLAIAYNFRKEKSFVWYFLQTIITRLLPVRKIRKSFLSSFETASQFGLAYLKIKSGERFVV